MIDPVRAVSGDHEVTVERTYAQAHELELLDPASPEGRVWVRGKLRGPTRRGGRPMKPTVNLTPVTGGESVELVAFDPAEHDVAAVLAHLGEADTAERERVLLLEQEGKARKGVLES